MENRNNLHNYFQTNGDVILPGMDVRMKLPRHVWYRYDGEVKSLVGNLAKTEMIILGELDLNRGLILKTLEWPWDRFRQKVWSGLILGYRPDYKDLTAYCHPHKVDNNGRTHAYVIAKRQGLEPSRSIFADGHESGEFLDEIKARNVMQEALEREKVELNSNLYEKEQFADLGGLLALRKAVRKGIRGLHIPAFQHRDQILPEQQKAFGIWS
jgi:hypothetical protein